MEWTERGGAALRSWLLALVGTPERVRRRAQRAVVRVQVDVVRIAEIRVALLKSRITRSLRVVVRKLRDGLPLHGLRGSRIAHDRNATRLRILVGCTRRGGLLPLCDVLLLQVVVQRSRGQIAIVVLNQLLDLAGCAAGDVGNVLVGQSARSIGELS